MTIEQAIQRWHERHSEQHGLDFVPAAVALTDRGNTAVMLSRLRRQLVNLDATDRAEAAMQIRMVLAELEPAASIA